MTTGLSVAHVYRCGANYDLTRLPISCHFEGNPPLAERMYFPWIKLRAVPGIFKKGWGGGGGG